MSSQGDIVLIPFPFSDLTGSKKRPALIVSNDSLEGDDFICCLITSNNLVEGNLILKKDFSEGKLPFKSWVKPHRVFTIDKRIIVKRLAKLKKEFVLEVKERIDSFIE